MRARWVLLLLQTLPTVVDDDYDGGESPSESDGASDDDATSERKLAVAPKSRSQSLSNIATTTQSHASIV